MSNFTPIVVGAAANASIINAPLYQLDVAITALQSLPASTAALTAIIGNMALSPTTSKIVTGAITELWTSWSAAAAAIATLQAAQGDMNTATTVSHVVVGAINELEAKIESLYIQIGNLNTTSLSQNLLLWAAAEAYQIISATYHPTYINTIQSAIVVWPDGSLGNFTTIVLNPTWEAIDAYFIEHLDSGKVVGQATVTRDTNGNVIIKPLLTVS